MTGQFPSRGDPVTLEVIRNALPAISAEMSYDLQRTSYNMMIYEVRDYCCALLDPAGNLLSQNMGGVSHFVSDLGVVIRDGIEKHGVDGFQPGDVVITNHQAVAGQHLNNIVIYTPFFFEGRLTGFPIVRAHWVDVGGLSTGFGAAGAAFDPWVEGLQLDQLKIYEAGQPDKKLLKVLSDNIRYPGAAMGDLRSQLAACRLAERRLEELYARYGVETMSHAIKVIFAESEQRCRAVVEQIPDGVYEAESCLDHDGVDTDVPIDIKVRITVSGSDMAIDLSGCSPQRRGGINSRTLAGALVAYKGLTAPLEPVNEGSFGAVKVIIPEGNMMMAQFPAPMAGWSMALPTVVDTIFKALAPAIPDRIPAAHLGVLGSPIVFFGFDPKHNRRFVLQSIEGGGWGGRPTDDGPSATVSVCQGDVRNSPIEAIELKAPVIVEERALREDSGGPGKHRGGLGLDVRVECLVEGRWNLLQSRRTLCPPWGLWGGEPGAIGDNLLKLPGEQDFTSVDVALHLVPAHAVVLQRSAGGGGWGDPLDRAPERVLADVINGFVTSGSARRDYGVVITADGRAFDAEMTKQVRAAIRGRRESQ